LKASILDKAARASGHTKKLAKHNAARALLELLEREEGQAGASQIYCIQLMPV
jgi:7-keto-8-aminopelargonate synthetase-like enzyme